MFDYEQLMNQLWNLKEESYAEFSRKLLPGTSNLIGIRLPQLRKIAKQIKKQDVEDYLLQVKHEFFEETLLMGFVIGTMEEPRYSLNVILHWIERYLPHIHNWSTCDSFCASLKIANNKPEAIFDYLENLWKKTLTGSDSRSNDAHKRDQVIVSDQNEYVIRFIIVMWLNYYLKEPYVDKIVKKLCSIRSKQYYVNMAIAWCNSMIFVSFPELIITYLQDNFSHQANLDSSELFVHNKTISKICESYQVEEERKKKIRSYKLKK